MANQSLRDLAASVRGTLRVSPVRLASRKVRNKRHVIHATSGPRNLESDGSMPPPIPWGYARTLLGVPGTLSQGNSHMRMLKPRKLSKRMQRVYRKPNLP